MARYVDIECDAVKEALLRCAFKTRQDIQDFLDDIPAADVVPVVHGRWTTKHYIDGIFEGTNFDECSACGYQRVFDDPALKTRYDYCPRCGAKMDGGAE